MRRPSPPRDIPPPLELECLKALWGLGEGTRARRSPGSGRRSQSRLHDCDDGARSSGKARRRLAAQARPLFHVRAQSQPGRAAELRGEGVDRLVLRRIAGGPGRNTWTAVRERPSTSLQRSARRYARRLPALTSQPPGDLFSDRQRCRRARARRVHHVQFAGAFDEMKILDQRSIAQTSPARGRPRRPRSDPRVEFPGPVSAATRRTARG